MTWLHDAVFTEPVGGVVPVCPVESVIANHLRQIALGFCPTGPSTSASFAIGMADAATVLWSGFHRFDAADPAWPDRDRFVLSPGYGTSLHHALLHLTGHDGMHATAIEGRRFGRLSGGYPDAKAHPAVEAAAGPLGQGFAMGVGMALAERMLAARFGKSLVDHRTWVIATLGDLMEGVSHEAASLAGHLRLDKLLVLLEDDSEGPDYCGGHAGPDDAVRRFATLGWATRTVDAHDPAAIEAAISLSARARRPTLIACHTRLGQGWGPAARQPEAAVQWAEAGRRGSTARRAWLKRLAHHPLRAEFDRVVAGRMPEGWGDGMASLKTRLARERRAASTRAIAERLLEALAPSMPELVGGQTEMVPGNGGGRSNGIVGPGSFSGRQVHYGPREHGMAACVNGLALHGGVLPYGVTTLAGTDAMRPALRLSALMGVRAIHVATHDSTGPRSNGACQPAEQLASLRAMPNLLVLRPADAVETAECCELAVRRADGPTLLVLFEQELPVLRTDVADNRSARGAYVLAEANGPRAATLIASGSEVSLAMDARERLMAEGIGVAVVSMPAWTLFARADAATRATVLGHAPRFGIEAACGFGWEKWLGEDGVFLGLPELGASAGAEGPFCHASVAAMVIAAAVKRRLAVPGA